MIQHLGDESKTLPDARSPCKVLPCPLPSPARASTETKDVPEGRAAENASHRDVLTATETRGSGLILQEARRSVSEALLADVSAGSAGLCHCSHR